MTDDGTDPTLTPAQAIGIAATSASATPAPATGQLPARYAAGRRLGAGGMGEVVLATDHQIGRDVAIKRMNVSPTPAAVARFVREAKIQGRLEHPAIVPVHELANDADGQPFFVMKRLTGTTLAERLAADPPPARHKLLRAFADVCLAVEFAHSRDVIHRDLKPSNIVLGDFGEVYILDWGIARVVDEPDTIDDHGAGPDTPTGGTDATLAASSTQTGAILGTPGYIAPELIRGEPIDTRADVFALGCILFDILAGEPLLPHTSAALDAALAPFDGRPSQRAIDREIPPELDQACAAAAASDRDQRPTARGLADQIERYLDGDRDLALRKRLACSHMEAANAALAGGDNGQARAIAMREAGRAIALDPHDSGAAQLVGRLMLEPPRDIPAEVDDRVEVVEEATVRQKARMLSVLMFCAVAFIPAFFWLGLRSTSLLVVYIVASLAVGLVTVRIAHQRRPISPADTYVLVVFNAVLIAVTSRLFTPFLVAPGIAALSVVLFVLDARLRWRAVTVIVGLAALGPWLLEFTGAQSRTMSSIAGDLVLHSELVRTVQPAVDIMLALYVVTLLAIGGVTARSVALAHRKALRSIELQAWHLRQLVNG